MKGRTVLLLDDDENVLVVLRAILEPAGARVLESCDEKAATEHCSNCPSGIDVLIADVVLHYSYGPAVVRRVKYLQPEMRILFISGYGIEELAQRGLLEPEDLASDAVGFLQKPFAAEELLGHVQRLVERRQAT